MSSCRCLEITNTPNIFSHSSKQVANEHNQSMGPKPSKTTTQFPLSPIIHEPLSLFSYEKKKLPYVSLCVSHFPFLLIKNSVTLCFDVYHMGDYHKVISGLLWKHSQWLYLLFSLFKGEQNIYSSWSTLALLYFCWSAWLPQLWATIRRLATSQKASANDRTRSKYNPIEFCFCCEECILF